MDLSLTVTPEATSLPDSVDDWYRGYAYTTRIVSINPTTMILLVKGFRCAGLSGFCHDLLDEVRTNPSGLRSYRHAKMSATGIPNTNVAIRGEIDHTGRVNYDWA